MSIPIEKDSAKSIIECPFSRRCKLPKNEEICRFPEFKICPEYTQRVKRIKVRGF